MSLKLRGRRNGTGPYKESFRRRVEGKSIGRREEAGEICPEKPKKKNIFF